MVEKFDYYHSEVWLTNKYLGQTLWFKSYDTSVHMCLCVCAKHFSQYEISVAIQQRVN